MRTAALNDSLLEVEDLHVSFSTPDRLVPAVRGVTFSVPRGKTLALVGESGAGKSVTAYALLRLVQPPGRIVKGRMLLRSARAGEIDIAALTEDSDTLFHIRGGLVSMIFQEPMTALSPVHTVGSQVAEAILSHHAVGGAEARRLTIDMLRRVGLVPPERCHDRYPHELSGGMRQRVVIAMALVCRPELLIADEPTTALDVTIQAQILGLIKALQTEMGCSVLLITHDLGVVAQMADDVAVMHRGQIVEHGSVRNVLKNPQHRHTREMLAALHGRRSRQLA